MTSIKRPIIHDNFPVHCSKAVKSWIENTAYLTEFPIPPKSSDLMPLCLVWKEIEKRVNTSTAIVSNANQLYSEVAETYDDLCNGCFVQEVIDAMPIILKQIIDMNGNIKE